MLGQPGALRGEGRVPVISRRTKELAGEIERRRGQQRTLYLCHATLADEAHLQGNPFVFFDTEAEIRVRIVEQPAMNESGADAYDLVDDVAKALHWQPRTEGTALGAILAHPLQLASQPTEMIADPQARIIEVIFEAIYGFQSA